MPNSRLTTLLTSAIDEAWAVINSLFNGLWEFLDRGFVMRRVFVGMTWYLTFKSYMWCFYVAEKSGYDPATIASSMAILTPISALQGFALKLYGDQKKNKNDA